MKIRHYLAIRPVTLVKLIVVVLCGISTMLASVWFEVPIAWRLIIAFTGLVAAVDGALGLAINASEVWSQEELEKIKVSAEELAKVKELDFEFQSALLDNLDQKAATASVFIRNTGATDQPLLELAQAYEIWKFERYGSHMPLGLGLDEIWAEFKARLGKIDSAESLKELAEIYLNRKTGLVGAQLKRIVDMPPELRRPFGVCVQRLKVEVEHAIAHTESKLQRGRR